MEPRPELDLEHFNPPVDFLNQWGWREESDEYRFGPNTPGTPLPSTPLPSTPSWIPARNEVERLLENAKETPIWNQQIPYTSFGPSMVSHMVPIEASIPIHPADNQKKRAPLVEEATKKRKGPPSYVPQDNNNRPMPPTPPQIPEASNGSRKMKPFSPAQVSDWKHVLYNLLVESYNSDNKDQCLVTSVEIGNPGQTRHGFSFNPNMQPRKKIAELYARHVRKETLELQDQKSNFTEDLYKYYLRCAYQLMCKYFMKVGPFTYVYEDVPLFIPGESLADAEDRLRNIDTKHRRKKKRMLLQGS